MSCPNCGAENFSGLCVDCQNEQFFDDIIIPFKKENFEKENKISEKEAHELDEKKALGAH
jgi:hypothetical protein